MWTVFVEYKIRTDRRDAFVRAIPAIRALTEGIAATCGHAFLAAADQPGLVVESITVQGLEEARKILALRGSEECPCGLDSLADGKRRAWLFENLDAGSL